MDDMVSAITGIIVFYILGIGFFALLAYGNQADLARRRSQPPPPTGPYTIKSVSAGMYPTQVSNRIKDTTLGGEITCAPKRLVFNKLRYGDPASNCWKDYTETANSLVNNGQTFAWSGYAATTIPGLDDPCPGVPKVIDYDMACY